MPNSAVAALATSPNTEPLHMLPGNEGEAAVHAVSSSPTSGASTLEGFAGIAASFRRAEAASLSAGCDFHSGEILIDSIMTAIMKFLVVFDALGSPILTAIVGKDFEAKTAVIQAAKAREGKPTVKELVDAEEDKKNNPTAPKRTWGFIPLPTKAEERGTEALWWCMRVMTFVDNLVLNLINDQELRNAAIIAYRNTLAHNHNAVTKGIFENALNFLPDTNTFLCNLYNIEKSQASSHHVEQLKAAMRDFRTATKPHIKAFQMVFPE